jgi:uncharacterized protein involved in outer membrane biogenesis
MPPAPPDLRERRQDAANRNEPTSDAWGEIHQPQPPPQPPRAGGVPIELRWLGGIVAASVLAVVVFCLLFQWNWLRGPLANLISARLHRPVAITGDLEVHPWSFSPRATVNGLIIGNPPWAGREPMARLPRFTVQVRLVPLIFGQVDLPLVAAERPDVHLVRDAQNRANWAFTDPASPSDQAIRLPPIQHFIIDNGHLTLNDAQRHATFDGTMTSNERSTGTDRGVFTLRGRGTRNHEPFYASLIGAPLLHISPDRPYPFTVHITSRASRIDARGTVPQPFDFGRFSTSLAVSGPDASQLYHLTGLALPNTPPYRVSGHFERDDAHFSYHHMAGRVGDSDLAGNIDISTERRPAMLRATLESRHLDFDDLATLFGGPPSVGRGETASPQQLAMAQHLRAEHRLFPDARLDTERLRVMNADVHYRAASVGGSVVPVRALVVHVRLQDRVLTADPLSMTLPQGGLNGSVRLNARNPLPVTDIDLRLSRGRVQDFLPTGLRANLQGGLVARARLRGTGPSVRAAASSANGQVSVVLPHGRMNEAMAELMGINLTRGLLLRWGHSRAQTDVRCGVASFHARGGVLTADQLVLATDSAVVRGGGTIDLRNETLNLRVQGRATRFRLVRLHAPLTLTGTLSHPQGGVELGHAAPQVGIAAVLAAVVSPFAAILPFVDPGLGHSPDCGSLVAGAQATPARR